MPEVLYKSSLIRAPFLLYEMRLVYSFLDKWQDRVSVIESVARQNLSLCPTECSSERITKARFIRIGFLEDASLLPIVANGPVEEAKQICLYAMMKQYRLVLDLLVTVAEWSESSVDNVRTVLVKLLAETWYFSCSRSSKLEPVFRPRQN